MSELIDGRKKGIVEEPGTWIDPTWKGVYRAGGLALATAGILYLIGATLGFYLGLTPGNSQQYFQSLVSHPVAAQFTYWTFSLADILFIPATLALYLALKEINKNAMLIAAGLLSFFIILDLGVTELNTLALVSIAESYASASSDTLREAYQAAANWGLATLPLATFFSWVGPSAGFLITSIVMRKGIFGRNTALLGVIVFTLGIAGGFYFLYPGLTILSLFLTPILILYGVWLIAVGRRLFKLGGDKTEA